MENNEKKRVEKVVSGEVKTRKKSNIALALQRFGLMPEDVEDVKDYILKEQIIPAFKNLIFDVFQSIIFGGEYRRDSRRKGGSHTSYENFYDGGNRNRSRSKGRSSFSYDELLFDSRADAEDVLDELRYIMHRYNVVTVADLYDTAGITCPHTYQYYGWNDDEDTDGARVSRTSEGWIIKLPRPKDIS